MYIFHTTRSGTILPMKFSITKIPIASLPLQIQEIPNPPEYVYGAGTVTSSKLTLLVIGSSTPSSYGTEITELLVRGLENCDVTVLAPLTEGISAYAINTAHTHTIKTILVPASGLDPKVLHPKSLHALVHTSLKQGGLVISEYENDTPVSIDTLAKRNRILAGLCDYVLVIEGEAYSQTLLTAHLCLEYNKNVLVVPGDIRSTESMGSNQLLHTGGTPITSVTTLWDALGIHRNTKINEPDEEELVILSLLSTEMTKDELMEHSPFDMDTTTSIILRMEMKEMIIQRLGKIKKR